MKNLLFNPRTGWMLLGCLGILLLLAPVLSPNDYVVTALSFALIYAILASSWDFLIGFAGLVSFGHAGFFGLGGYAAALMTYHLGLSPWLGLPIGAVAGALLGFVVGIPTLRLRSIYLALATLAFAESLRIIASNWHDLTRGTLGFNLHRTFFRLSGETTSSYYLILALAVLSVAGLYGLARHTRFGLTMQAVRDDDLRAAALGVDVVRVKVQAFAIAGAVTGAAGALYAHYIGLVSPTDLGPTMTMLVVAMATIGGIGTILGPAIAALFLYLVSEAARMIGPTWGQIVIGMLLVGFVVLLPDGVAGTLSRLVRKR